MGQLRILSFSKKIISKISLLLMGLVAISKLGGTLSVTISVLISLVVYAFAFGTKFAIGFMALLFAHEIGHVFASRVVGLRTTGPMFIPFVGAVIKLNRIPINRKTTANIAIGGPALGCLSALVCLCFYFWTDSVLMLVLAYTACLLNLFNLIPCAPLDGEKIVSAISPKLWWFGSLVIGVLFIFTHNIVIFIILLFSIFEVWQKEAWAYKDNKNKLPLYERFTIAWWYLGILSVLSMMTWYITQILP